MKKKNLIILLVFPFLISVFCIITVNTTYNKVDVDISHIDWNYRDMEGFEISEDVKYKLEATGVNQRYYAVSGGNALKWSVENKDPSDPDPCAEIVVDGDSYYLVALKAGEVIITCSNEKGNVQRRLNAVIYKDAAVMMYPTVSSSQSNVDPVIYYGEYDHRIGTAATIDMTVITLPSPLKSELEIEHSDNLRYDRDTDTITVIGTGEAYIRAADPQGRATPVSFEFYIVDEGVNVYTYDDLLYCTNFSTGGHIAVLRVHFESLENTYMMNGDSPAVSGGSLIKKNNANNVQCFGNYDYRTKSFSFGSEIYSFVTTYNRSFIDQWNEFASSNKQYSPITDKVNVGLHVQKNFYGNGYTINLHNLTYPYSFQLAENEAGEQIRIPMITSANLFRGPLKMYSLGDPSGIPLVSLYGQDNIGMYVEGDGIVVNDLNIKNCDFGDRMANLDTVGTVMEIYGDNITVRNSRLSNGKNVLRSFSSMNFTLENSLLSGARNFLFVTGANEYKSVNLNQTYQFTGINGNKVTMTLGEYIAAGAPGDEVINTFIRQTFGTTQERDAIKAAIMAIQTALNDAKGIENDYRGSTVIRDTYFYKSGIAAICMESLFNSPFLETASSPSLISSLMSNVDGAKSLIPYFATSVSGISYPVKLEVKGNTRFYDYKEVGKIDLSGLIEENISTTANDLGLYDGNITIDDIFPLQSILAERASLYSAIHTVDGKRYYNIPVAFYGGGLNLSEVTFDTEEVSSKVEVDLLDRYARFGGSSSAGAFGDLAGLMRKTVITVAGFESFYFHFVKGGYLYGETPDVSDLVNNARGGS